ncbi:hypothetical protein GQ651_09165 [Alphaproteobacteria bacterium GH1-50]|uniref:RiboL-PSP-HEPN domain-containing protein n=1 Tax=Kangsaoukella pontilimi TaxID=2691042 RepID=A0A7C9MAG4_9RHOB|nr:hypothetical protein [Kangsaoukella pontilimi]MXQ08013.1 hypothetical protein [Kangsaoukella pontilimi]
MATRKLRPIKKKKPYTDASDEEKVARNWTKTLGLFERGEYSASTLRAAITLELMVNFAIREELVVEKGLPLEFVDKLLKDANGITRKYQGIFLPIMLEYEEHDELKTLWNSHIKKVNERRNRIAHGGEFDNKKAVKELLQMAHHVLERIVVIFGSTQTFRAPG